MADRFYIPLTPAEHKTVTERVSKRIVAHWKASTTSFFDHLLGLEQPSGRERITIYRRMTQEDWDKIIAIRPDRAAALGRDWMALRHKYPLPPPAPTPPLDPNAPLPPPAALPLGAPEPELGAP